MLVAILVSSKEQLRNALVMARNLKAHGQEYRILVSHPDLQIEGAQLVAWPEEVVDDSLSLLWQVPHTLQEDRVLVLPYMTLFSTRPQLIFELLHDRDLASLGNGRIILYRRSAQLIWQLERWLKTEKIKGILSPRSLCYLFSACAVGFKEEPATDLSLDRYGMPAVRGLSSTLNLIGL